MPKSWEKDVRPLQRGTLDGLPVYDAVEPLVIEVIERDIDYTARKDPECCAIAQACMREIHCERARVHLSRVYLRQENFWLRYALPETARTEVILFDRGHEFRTGVYRLAAMAPAVRAGNRGGKKKTKTGTGRPRVPGREVEGVRARSPLHGQPTEHF